MHQVFMHVCFDFFVKFCAIKLLGTDYDLVSVQ